jgi:hypothetical protein
MLAYLDKKNSNEGIQTVSEEDKEGMRIVQHPVLLHGIGRQVLKRSVRGQQNPTLNVGRGSRYEK